MKRSTALLPAKSASLRRSSANITSVAAARQANVVSQMGRSNGSVHANSSSLTLAGASTGVVDTMVYPVGRCGTIGLRTLWYSGYISVALCTQSYP